MINTFYWKQTTKNKDDYLKTESKVCKLETKYRNYRDKSLKNKRSIVKKYS